MRRLLVPAVALAFATMPPCPASAATATLQGGTLTVTGGAGADNITVYQTFAGELALGGLGLTIDTLPAGCRLPFDVACPAHRDRSR